MSLNFTFRTDGLRETSDRFANASRNEVSGKIHQMLRKIGRFLVPTMREEEPRGATGKLRAGTGFTIEGIRDLRLVVYDGQQYGRFVRGGTRPHWPPAGPIRQWVTAKLGVGGAQADRVTYLVRRKISRVGTKPNEYHVRTLAKHRADIERAGAEVGIELTAYLAGKR